MSDTFSDNDDLILDDGDANTGRPPLLVTDPNAGMAGAVIADDDRDVPTFVDPKIAGVDLAPYFYARAHHNLPGWGLLAARYDEVDKDGKGIGEPVNVDDCDGWIPNDEEGVHAVEIGFAEMIEAPQGAEMPEA